MNIQYSTSNVQRPISKTAREFACFEYWELNVKCSMFEFNR